MATLDSNVVPVTTTWNLIFLTKLLSMFFLFTYLNLLYRPLSLQTYSAENVFGTNPITNY